MTNFTPSIEEELSESDNLSSGGHESVGHGMSYGALSFVSNLALLLISSIASSRLYGVDGLGVYALAMAPSVLLSALSATSESVALVRKLAVLPARSPRASALTYVVYSWSALVTVVIGAIVFVATAVLLNGPLHHSEAVLPALVMVISFTVFENTSYNINMVLSAYRAGRSLFISRFAQTLVFLIVVIVARAYTNTAWGIVIATVASQVIPFFLRVILVRAYISLRVSMAEIRRAFRELPEIIVFGMRIFPGTILGQLAAQSGTWVLAAVASTAALGAYSRAYGLANRLSEMGFRVGEILLPTLTYHHENGDHAALHFEFTRTIRYLMVPLGLITAFSIGGSTGILSIFGPGFTQAHTAFALLTTGYVFGIFSYTYAQLFMALGQPFLLTKHTAIRTVITIAATFPLAEHFGASGVGFAYLAGYIIDIAIKMITVHKIFSQDEASIYLDNRRVTAGIFVAGGLAALASWSIYAAINSLFGVVLMFLLGPSVFIVGVWSFGGWSAEEKREVKKMVRKLIKRNGSTVSAGKSASHQ